jgi:hypothetical protein
MFKELKERKSSSHHSVSARKREALKKIPKHYFRGRSTFFGFSLFVGSLGTQTPPKRGMDVLGCSWLLSCILYQLVKDFP